MSDFLPIVAAVATTVGTILAGVFATRRLAKFGLSSEQLQVNKTLRELAETEKAKRTLVEEENEALRSQLKDARHDLDDCVRQRDNAFSELRGVARRAAPRRPAERPER